MCIYVGRRTRGSCVVCNIGSEVKKKMGDCEWNAGDE